MRVRLAAALVLTVSAVAVSDGQRVVRTADPFKRGLQDSDFPRTVRLAGNVYAYEDLRWAGDERFTTVNLFVITSEGVVVADGQGSAEATRRLLDAIARLTSQPVTHVVVCSDHGDHTGGNASFPAGVKYFVHPTSKATLEKQAGAADARPDGWKMSADSEVVADRKVLTLGGEVIELLFLGRAHTGGDLSVYLPKHRILFMSEAYLNRLFPAMRSAYPSEWVAMLKRTEAMDVERYVPGHGFVEEPAVSREELVEFRRALEGVIAEASRLHEAGVAVEEAVKQANFGEYRSWTLYTSQSATAIRRVYDELEGRLK